MPFEYSNAPENWPSRRRQSTAQMLLWSQQLFQPQPLFLFPFLFLFQLHVRASRSIAHTNTVVPKHSLLGAGGAATTTNG